MYKFSNRQADIKNVPIDMRYESNMLTDEFGINVIYIRNNKFVRCRCFDDLNKTGDSNCKLCMGTGYFISAQKIRVIESSNRAYGFENNMLVNNIGVTNQKNEVYYIRYKYSPKERDLILKVTWDSKGNPIDIDSVLEIINVYTMRGDNGRLELAGCLINSRTDLVTPYQKYLDSLSKKLKTLLANGGKCIWTAKLLEQ